MSARAAAKDDPRLLSPEQVSEQYGIPVRTLEWWRYTGKGPQWLRLGHRTIRYRPADLRAWFQQQAKGA